MFNADRLIKRRTTPSDIDSVKARRAKLRNREKDPELLLRCRRCHDNLDDFRQQRARGRRFAYGDQWADTIVVNGETMTYREYLMRQGNVVIQTNQIKNRVDTIVGVMVKEESEPVCHAIDREEQQYGEIMTAALQANCHKNVMPELNKMWMRDVCLGGLAVSYESYDDCSGPTRRLDSWTSYVNPNYVFFESAAIDPRFWDLTLVGMFSYCSFDYLCSKFARTPADYEMLREIYSAPAEVFKEDEGRQITDRNSEEDVTFMRSEDESKCFVCEVWTKETKARIRLNDTQDGTEEIIDADDKEYRKAVKQENLNRRKLAQAAGWAEEEVSYIIGDGFGNDELERNGFFVDTYWYCRFLAPDGTILWEGESPYADRSHPFSFCVFPFVDGKIVGYMNDAIDHNLAMNRAVVLHDWLTRAQAKGVTVVPKKIIPKDVSPKDFARSWSSIDDLVFVEMEPGEEKLMPQVFHGAVQSFDVGNLINTYAKLMDSGTPVNGALQGQTPNSGTSGALYAQMATNSSTPIAALLESFHKFMESVYNKKAKNIAKFYDHARFAAIAGQVDDALGNANVNLNEIGDLEFDLNIRESTNAPVFRAVINQDAKEFLMAGLISFEEYLEIADLPYADKILQSRQARQAEMEAAQQQGTVPSSPSQLSASSDTEAQQVVSGEQQGPYSARYPYQAGYDRYGQSAGM